VPPRVVGLDAKAYRRCTVCLRRGRLFRPYHRGAEYRAISQCLGCGHAEEV
jgi:hypothetical protein